MKNFLKAVPLVLLLSSCIPSESKYGDKPKDSAKTSTIRQNLKDANDECESEQCDDDCYYYCTLPPTRKSCCYESCEFAAKQSLKGTKQSLKQDLKNADAQCSKYGYDNCDDKAYQNCMKLPTSKDRCCTKCCPDY